MTSFLVPLTHSISPFFVRWCSQIPFSCFHQHQVVKTPELKTPTHSQAHTIRPSLGFKYHRILSAFRSMFKDERANNSECLAIKLNCAIQHVVSCSLACIIKNADGCLIYDHHFNVAFRTRAILFSLEVMKINAKLLRKISFTQKPTRKKLT